MTAKRESNLSVTCMITDRIGRQEVLLPSNHNHYNFQKQQIHFGQISMVETMSKVKKKFSILEIPQFILGLLVVPMVIVINSVISGLG